jgi:hypothetical protein
MSIEETAGLLVTHEDYSRDKGDVAILWLGAREKRLERPGYYVVKVLQRDDAGRVLRFANRLAARRDSVAAAQHALDFWAARFVTGGVVTSDEVLQEWALAVEKGLVRDDRENEVRHG